MVCCAATSIERIKEIGTARSTDMRKLYEAGLSKHFAYCTPIIGAQLHRQRGFRVRMNENAAYPQILEVIEEVPLPKAERKKPTVARGLSGHQAGK